MEPGLISGNPEWSDVTPLQQDEIERSVIRIAYSDTFREIHDYLRAVLKADERSPRCLNLTKKAIELNPANYTTWHYRRQCLETLNSDMNEELEYVGDIIRDNPKNYQVWYHRRWVAERLNDSGEKELDFTETVLQEDSKNYHAWEHRQWALKTFSLWENELQYTEKLIDEDCRNNSAWNQRYFVIKNTTGFTENVRGRELNFTLTQINRAVSNESAWNYLRGIYLPNTSEEPACVLLSRVTELWHLCEELESSADTITGPHHLALLVDLLTARMEMRLRTASREGGRDALVRVPKSLEQIADVERAVRLCELLATEVDVIRRQYWTYVKNKLLLTYADVADSRNDSGDAATASLPCHI